MTTKTTGIIAAILLTALIVWGMWGNTALELNEYTISSEKVPAAFNGFRIAHVSDLHNDEMGQDNERLFSMLRESCPDIIAITGDLIDSRQTDVDVALRFAEQAVTVAPCFYVTGNHEARISRDEYKKLTDGLTNAGVVILNNEEYILEKSGECISVIGVADPSFCRADMGASTSQPTAAGGASVTAEAINALSSDDSFTLLLSHRPELFEQYVDADIDLILCGHAHGGQFRLPFIGGLAAPNQGLFPKYDAGLFTAESTSMIVSRGIGNSIFPFRLNNRPEVIMIQLQSVQ